jgi:hypothetical protein
MGCRAGTVYRFAVSIAIGWLALDAFAVELLVALGDAATLSHDRLGESLTLTELHPQRAGALPVVWIVSGDSEVILQAGPVGGRWELEQNELGLTFLQRVTLSVVSGRVTETFGMGRSRVEVTMEDGHVETSATKEQGARFSQPGWRRRGRRVQYLAYR